MQCLLAKLFSEDGSQVFRNLERLDGNSNSGNSLGRFSINSVLGNTFLDGNVIGILRKEVRHSVKYERLKSEYIHAKLASQKQQQQ